MYLLNGSLSKELHSSTVPVTLVFYLFYYSAMAEEEGGREGGSGMMLMIHKLRYAIKMAEDSAVCLAYQLSGTWKN